MEKNATVIARCGARPADQRFNDVQEKMRTSIGKVIKKGACENGSNVTKRRERNAINQEARVRSATYFAAAPSPLPAPP